MPFRKQWIAGLVALMVMISTACNTASPPEPKVSPETVNRYSNDSIAREVNPNMVTGRNTDINNIDLHGELMADRASRVQGVEAATVSINGGTAYIILNLENQTAREESAQIKQEVTRVLQKMMPRYQIRVTLNDNRWKRMVRPNR